MKKLIAVPLLLCLALAQEDFPLRFKVTEAHITQTPKCWMTMTDSEGMTYVVEEVTVFGCGVYEPRQTFKGKRDKNWIDLVGPPDKKGKVKVTRWEIKQEVKS